jgi:hypothetical protein
MKHVRPASAMLKISLQNIFKNQPLGLCLRKPCKAWALARFSPPRPSQKSHKFGFFPSRLIRAGRANLLRPMRFIP